MSISTFNVSGMTCGHCAGSVTEGLTGLAGVENVEVDVAAGLVKISSTGQIDEAAVREAVAEAGYAVV